MSLLLSAPESKKVTSLKWVWAFSVFHQNIPVSSACHWSRPTLYLIPLASTHIVTCVLIFRCDLTNC